MLSDILLNPARFGNVYRCAQVQLYVQDGHRFDVGLQNCVTLPPFIVAKLNGFCASAV